MNMVKELAEYIASCYRASLREAAQAVVDLTDDLARWDELNRYVVNSQRDYLAGNLSAAWGDLRAALAQPVPDSIPQHAPSCASQDDDAECICGVNAAYVMGLRDPDTLDATLAAVTERCAALGWPAPFGDYDGKEWHWYAVPLDDALDEGEVDLPLFAFGTDLAAVLLFLAVIFLEKEANMLRATAASTGGRADVPVSGK